MESWKRAKEKLKGYQDNKEVKVTIEKQDFTNFNNNITSASFDRYLANMCLHYAEDPDVVVREAWRILKPSGICGFTVWGKASKSPLMTIVPDVLDDFGLVKMIKPFAKNS